MISKIFELDEKNYSVSDEQKAIAVWLVKKYTSFTWIKRTSEFLEKFANGYESWVRSSENEEWKRDVLQGLRVCLEYYQKGLSTIRKGNLERGHELVLEGTAFSNWLEGLRQEYYLGHDEIGYRSHPEKPVGLYAIGALAKRMASETRLVLSAIHKLPLIIQRATLPPDILEKIEPLIPISGTIIHSNKEIPTRGIWLPVNHPFGCPQYLEKGDFGIEIGVPKSEARDWESTFSMMSGDPPIDRIIFYHTVPGKFQLLWKEDRYAGGKIPDESEYLDPTTNPDV